MRYVTLIIRDLNREMHALRDEHFAVALAALAAEPETIEELDAVMERYVVPDERGERNCLDGFSTGLGEESRDEAVVIVDLPGRLIVSDFEFEESEPGDFEADEEAADDEAADDEAADGEAFVDAEADDEEFHGDYPETYAGTPIRLSDEWLRSEDVSGWRHWPISGGGRGAADPPFDARAILYGRPLVEFISRECWDVFHRRPRPSVPAAEEVEGETAWRPLTPEEREEQDLVRQIHARWLMTAREDLRGKTPREILVARRESISWDLNDRTMQWAHEGRCPRGLDERSAGYRFAGFGTHELVTYYELLRHLLWSCRDSVADRSQDGAAAAFSTGDFAAAEVPRLAELREAWLDAPDPEFGGRTPRSIIHNERARRPEGGSGADAVVDCDCPLCQMQAEMPGPVFWGLDGCNMDDEFAFSFDRTLAEWEEEQRRHAEFNRKFEAEQEEKKRLGVELLGGIGEENTVWTRSYTDDVPGQPLVMQLFSVGTHLSELIVDLKEPHRDGPLPAECRELVDQLSRDFGNLREVAGACGVEPAEALVEPVLARFCQTLEAVASSRTELERKCSDLERRLRRFGEPCDATEDFASGEDDDGLPF